MVASWRRELRSKWMCTSVDWLWLRAYAFYCVSWLPCFTRFGVREILPKAIDSMCFCSAKLWAEWL